MERSEAIQRAYPIPGQAWPQELGWMYDTFRGSKRHAEVGVFCGRSLFASCAGMAGAVAWAIDCDNDDSMPGFVAPSRGWVAAVRTATIAGLPESVSVHQTALPSIEAAAALERNGVILDSVWIDASHHYADVQADITAWRRLVRQGGILAGHDFWASHPGVMDAVNEAFGDGVQTVVNTRVWWVRI